MTVSANANDGCYQHTSPLNYLVQIGEADTVASLYGVIHVPTAVLNELRAAEAPETVRRWSDAVPSWLQAHTVPVAQIATPVVLHPGETEAIQLARQLNADFLIMDELDGRAAARAAGLTVIGTLAVLELAAIHGSLDFPDAVRRLRATSFYVSARLLQEFLNRDRLRRER